MMKKVVTFLAIFLLFSSPLFAFAKKRGLRAKLIHRDSIHSPYRNTTDSSYHDRAELYLKSSIARFAYLAGIKEPINVDDEGDQDYDYKFHLIPTDNHMIFMANVSVGTPPVSQLLLMDTGSSLSWFQCLPCTKCFAQSIPLFDPSKSTTYKNLTCEDPHCHSPQPAPCDAHGPCVYNQRYFDGDGTIGTLAYETLTFETSDDGLIEFSNILIGCGHDNVGKDGKFSGVIGLGTDDNLSLVYRLDSRFSYCIGSINDPHYEYNSLILGSEAIIEGMMSPLEAFNGYHYMSVEGISVGSTRLEIDPTVFKRLNGKADTGFVIDSGTTVTFLVPEAYEPLIKEVERVVLNGSHVQINEILRCYKGKIDNFAWFPLVTFHLNGGGELTLNADSLFMQTDPNRFCMTILQSPSNTRFSIFGIWSQQGYNIGYDLTNKNIFFHRIDCRLLE